MTKDEQDRLRAALARQVENWKQSFPDLITAEFTRLDEDSGQFYTTEAEILVYGLPRDDLYKLHVAYQAYEILIGIVDDAIIGQEIYELTIKARAICPPVRFYDYELPFRLRNDEYQWFQWFGKSFLDLSFRSTYAFWHKHHFNLDGLVTYADE